MLYTFLVYFIFLDLRKYYQTRAEKEIIDTSAPEICAHSPDITVVVELGSGSATKTVPIIHSLLRQIHAKKETNTCSIYWFFPYPITPWYEAALEPRIYYVPIDISQSMLVDSSRRLLTEITDPSFFVTAVCGFYRYTSTVHLAQANADQWWDRGS